MKLPKGRGFIPILVIAIIFIFWGIFALSNYDNYINALLETDPSILVLSFPLLLLTYFLVILTWKILLGLTGQKIGFGVSARLWLVSNISKYIPGTIWMPASRGYFGKREGVSLTNMYTSCFLEIYLQIAATVLISIIFVSLFQTSQFLIPLVILVIVLVSSFIFRKPGIRLSLRVFSRFRKAKRIGHSIECIEKIKDSDLINPLLLYILKFIVYGLWLMVIAWSVAGIRADLFFFVFVWSLSWVISFVIIFVPSGLGVREGVMTILLTSAGYSIEAAVIISIITRLEFFLFDGILGFSSLMKTKRDQE
jgi:uncharacterized membrane protein YbhN (UPF0104 family)